MAAVTIRLARIDEAPLLTELAMRSKAHWGYDALFMERCRGELTVLPADIAHQCTFVFEERGRLLGFYALSPLDHVRTDLSWLFVEPAFIGRGYGRALIEHAKQQAQKRGFAVLEIQGDPHATRFYEASGARLVGTKPSASIAGRVLPLFRIELVGM